MPPQTATDDPVADLLRGQTRLTDAQRAVVWDAFTQSADEDALTSRLQRLPFLPMDAKATLWDLKTQQRATPTPAPQTSPPSESAPTGPFAALGIKTVSDEEWAKMTPQERLQGILKAAGYGISGMLGMGEAGREAVEHPGMTLATAAIPGVISGARGMLPSSVRAGARFQEVMGAAKNVPVNVEGPGTVALRIQQLAERGGAMPKVVRDFLRRVTDPSKPPIVYEEARDFYHNISRLSADEYKRLTPVISREVGNLRVALNRAIEGAAQEAGKLSEYQAAMREYARRARLDELASDIWTGAKRALPFAGATAAATWGAKKLSDFVSGE